MLATSNVRRPHFIGSVARARGITPDPIPNSEVKPASADGTARETVGESRTDGTVAELRERSGAATLEGAFNKLTATENLLARAEEFARALAQ